MTVAVRTRRAPAQALQGEKYRNALSDRQTAPVRTDGRSIGRSRGYILPAAAEYLPVTATSPATRAAPDSGSPDRARPLARLLGRLAEVWRTRSATTGESGPTAEREAIVAGIELALAALRYLDAAPGSAARPPQVAVVGPTQAGKSTVFNLLLGGVHSEVSPLAGFTVHPRGLRVGPLSDDEGWTADLLPGWRRCEPDALRRDVLEAFSLSNAGGAAGLPDGLPSCVVWDTPDFDSLAARHYARSVLEIAALADVHLLVVSKEKYADQCVWRWLELVQPLGRPLIVCLNKVTPEAESVLLRALEQQLGRHGHDVGSVPIVPLPYVTGGAGLVGHPGVARLRRQVRERLTDLLARPRRDVAAAALVRRHWEHWLAPVRVEHAARRTWLEWVEAAAGRFMQAYTRDYLEHPQRYDTFRRASLELLNLIELPHVGGAIARARQVVAWPMRQVMVAAGNWWRGRRPGELRGVHSLGAEATVLLDTWHAQVASLHREAGRRAAARDEAAPYWAALAGELDAQRESLRAGFDEAIARHHEAVSQAVHAAARGLYQSLLNDPARLSVLRAARTTIDVGAILLAIKTGGLSVLDAVWAPAAFGAASLLVETLSGLELQRVNRALRERQREAVQRDLVAAALVAPLSNLAERVRGPGLASVGEDELAAATAELARLEGRDG